MKSYSFAVLLNLPVLVHLVTAAAENTAANTAASTVPTNTSLPPIQLANDFLLSLPSLFSLLVSAFYFPLTHLYYSSLALPSLSLLISCFRRFSLFTASSVLDDNHSNFLLFSHVGSISGYTHW